MTNNPLHGYESFKLPNLSRSPVPPSPTARIPTASSSDGGMPVDQPIRIRRTPSLSRRLPTYDNTVNSIVAPTPERGRRDEPLHAQSAARLALRPSDLEWLYRQQDVDGASLTSRLSQLAPVSFTNTIDGQRRRRLFALDTWEMNNFVWANDNPGQRVPQQQPVLRNRQRRFAPNASASLQRIDPNAELCNPRRCPRRRWPSATRRSTSIIPLPVSNDPNEPIRQKWISDTYQLLKASCPRRRSTPPRSWRSSASSSINIVDFRDPDCHDDPWVNPDVMMCSGTIAGTPADHATYCPRRDSLPAASTTIHLDQYGMEYNPVAINEVLAYSFRASGAGM